ncbi:TPA: hypothetical protein ACX6O9_000757 [Photobacterium damselae]
MEYHGKQRFEPVEFFGGVEAFKKQWNVINEKYIYQKKWCQAVRRY